jgi:hypothetical protein
MMEAHERFVIEAECARLINRFMWLLDAFDEGGLVALFAPDCTYSRAGKEITGIDDLRATLERRSRDQTTRHVCTNIVIDAADRDHASGKACCLVFRHRGLPIPGQPAPLRVPESLLLFDAAFVRTPAGWRIAKWRTERAFRKPANVRPRQA